MKKPLIVLTLISIFFMGFRAAKPKEIIIIEFRDFFKTDSISLTVNNVKVLSTKIVTSDESTGSTGEKIILKKDGSKYFVTCKKKEIAIAGRNQKSILLTVTLNGISTNYKIDPDLGKYVGFSKGEKNTLKMSQSAKPFIYD